MRVFNPEDVIMVVTADDREDTLYVFDSPKESDTKLKLPKGTTSEALYQHKKNPKSHRYGMRFIRVRIGRDK